MFDEDTGQGSYDIELPDGPLRFVSAHAADAMRSEIERLQHHVDAAFNHLCSQRYEAAREELTWARLGTSRP